jgi:formamidopyrimidine-DNA glycosylase
MPELPEVEAIRVWLDERVFGRGLRGARLEAVERWEDGLDLDLPLTIEAVERWGKELAVRLEGAPVLAVHLRMAGDLVAGVPEKARLVLRTDRGAVSLVDGRRLARVRLADLPPELGDDALDAPPSGDRLRAILGGRRRAIKPLLLEQSLVSGLGNIWVDEVLFEAKVHPETPAAEGDLDAVARAIRAVVPRATARLVRGVSADGHGIEWVRHEGKDDLEAKVHRREGEPCTGCGAIIEKLRVGGRGTYVCPRCQAR